MKPRRPIFGIDSPHEKKSVIDVSERSQILRAGIKCKATNSKRVLVDNREGNIGRGIFRRGEDQSPGIVASLAILSTDVLDILSPATAFILTSPTARKFPSGLIETLVTALILSRDDHGRGLPVSATSLDGELLWLFPVERRLDRDLALASGVAGGVDWL